MCPAAAALAASPPLSHVPPSQLGGTALSWAALNGHIEAVDLLLTSGANINHANDVHAPPTARAACWS